MGMDFKPIFQDVCQGDADAERWCWAFLAWVHLIDDQVDGELHKWSAQEIVRANLEAALNFASNPFWRKHRHTLWPLIFQGARAFEASEQWMNGTDEQKSACFVLKSQYQEALWYVAYLVGGWEHYVRCTDQYRRYFRDE